MRAPDTAPSPGAARPLESLPPRTGRAVPAIAAVLIAGAFAVVLAGVQSELFDLDRHLVPKALALHATALVGLVFLVRSWRRFTLELVDALLVVWALWTVLSAALATNRWLALHASAISVSGVVLYLAARQVARTTAASRVLAGVVLAAVLAAALGVAQAYGADWPLLADSRPPGGTFGNRNFLAHVLAIALPAVLLIAVRARPAGAAAAFLGLAVIAATILLTRSRAAWLAEGVALVIMALGAIRGRRAVRAIGSGPRLAFATAAVACGIIAAIVVPNRLEWRSPSPYTETLTRLTSYSEGSGRGRLIQYRNSLDLIPDDPIFGVGPGNWLVHYPRVTTRGDPSFAGAETIPTNPWPSSDWIALLVERGAIGALLLLAAWLTAGFVAWRRLGEDGEPARVLGAVALMGTLGAAAVTGMFDAVMLLAAPTLFTFTLVGLLLPDARRPVFDRAATRAQRSIAGGISVAFVAAALLASAGTLTAIVLTADSPSRATLARAVRFDPGNHRLRLLLARRGSCQARTPHALAAARLMPHHDATARALRACGLEPPE